MSFIISALKIICLLGFLIFIHEGGHFTVAKLCNVKVNQFAIGFGPAIWKYQGKETKYAIRLIPLGGFVSMEGEDQESSDERAFNKASIPKRILIVVAGACVNIIFGIISYFLLLLIIKKNLIFALQLTGGYFIEFVNSIKMLFIGGVGINDLTGPVGISQIISNTEGIKEFIYMLSVISLSLGITNLLPIPALDGGKIVLLLIEAIRKKPFKENTEAQIQLIGFSILMALSIFVTYNDIIRIMSMGTCFFDNILSI